MKASLKAYTSIAAALCLAAPAVAQEEAGAVPQLLRGVWQNGGRYVSFGPEPQDGAEPAGAAIPQIALRVFYGWYADRAAESPEYSAAQPRDTNDATSASSPAERMELRFVPLTDELFAPGQGDAVVQDDGDVLTAESLPSGAWDIQVRYAGRRMGGEQVYHVPVAVIGDKLYLRFAIKEEDSDSVPVSALLNGTVLESGNLLAGYWQDAGSASGILVSPPVTADELLCYYITDDAAYPLRYWRTDMEYDADARATFSDGGETYSVPKHLRSGGRTYACTLGRRTAIRNVRRLDALPEGYTLNSVLVQKSADGGNGSRIAYTVRTATICAFGEPYLTLSGGGLTLEEIAAADNARRKPAPPPLFPPHGVLDFDWSIIEDPPRSWNRRMLDLGK